MSQARCEEAGGRDTTARVQIEIHSLEADDRCICIPPSSLHLNEAFAPTCKSRQGIHDTLRAEEWMPDHVTCQPMSPCGALHIVHHENVAAVQNHVVDAALGARQQADIGQILRQLPPTIDANGMAGRDVEATRKCCDLFARTPDNLRHTPHHCHTAVCNTQSVACTNMSDGDRLLDSHLVDAADEARGGKATATCARIVRGHVWPRGPARAAVVGGCGPATGSTLWPGRWQRQEDLVSSFAERPEEGTTIRLQAGIHEVGADLKLMGTHQCPEVVLPPPVEAIFAPQRLRHSAICVTLECRQSAVSLPCSNAPAQSRRRSLEASTELLHGLHGVLALVLGCALDGKIACGHGICPAERNDGIGSRCAVLGCGAHAADAATRPGVSQNDLQVRLATRVAVGTEWWHAERHDNLARLPVLQRPQTYGLAPALILLCEATQHWSCENGTTSRHQIQRSTLRKRAQQVRDAVDESRAHDDSIRNKGIGSVPFLREGQQELAVQVVAESEGVQLACEVRVGVHVVAQLGDMSPRWTEIGLPIGEQQDGTLPVGHGWVCTACAQRLHGSQDAAPDVCFVVWAEVVQDL
mmetsp:Transcript_98643/g.318106  ORF Transcript_98643/g.318106 Transcript_98643/m.318106 type:complete len:583 (+) Transcript_98643:430-2178(+)